MTEWMDTLPPKDKPFIGYVLVGYHFNESRMKDDRKKEIHTCIWDDFNQHFEEYCNCSGYEREQERIEVLKWMPIPEPSND